MMSMIYLPPDEKATRRERRKAERDKKKDMKRMLNSYKAAANSFNPSNVDARVEWHFNIPVRKGK